MKKPVNEQALRVLAHWRGRLSKRASNNIQLMVPSRMHASDCVISFLSVETNKQHIELYEYVLLIQNKLANLLVDLSLPDLENELALEISVSRVWPLSPDVMAMSMEILDQIGFGTLGQALPLRPATTEEVEMIEEEPPSLLALAEIIN